MYHMNKENILLQHTYLGSIYSFWATKLVAQHHEKLNPLKSNLFFLFLSIPCFSAHTQSTCMSFNIRFDNPDDGINSWDKRKEAVVKFLNYYNPNILGIQEGLSHQVQYLDEKLKDYNYVGVGRDDGKQKGEYSAIFFDTSCIQLINTKTYWLSPTPDTVSVGWDASMERIITYANFLDKRHMDTFYVFNTHFDNIGKQARKNSADLIIALIKTKELLDKKVIVMGDLNCLPSSDPLKILKSYFYDPWNEQNTFQSYGPSGTFNHFDPACVADKRIDYILTHHYIVSHYRHIDDRKSNGLWMSDHLPVWIAIKRSRS